MRRGRQLLGVLFRGAAGRMVCDVHPADVWRYRWERGYRYAVDPLERRAELLAELRASGELVPALCARADHLAWMKLWIARDRVRCPNRPEHERVAYALRLGNADLLQTYNTTHGKRTP